MNLFFQIQSLQLLVFCMDDQEFVGNLFSYVFFCDIVKLNLSSYHFIILLHLISSFSLTRFLVVPCAYASIVSIDCILLLSFELKAILLISSVKSLRVSLLNFCCVCDIHLLYFMNSLCFLL